MEGRFGDRPARKVAETDLGWSRRHRRLQNCGDERVSQHVLFTRSEFRQRTHVCPFCDRVVSIVLQQYRRSCANICHSSVNLVIRIARPILQRQASIVEVCKGAEIEWCDTIQTALSKTVLTRSCSNVSCLPIIVMNHAPADDLQWSNILTQKRDGISSHILSILWVSGLARGFLQWTTGITGRLYIQSPWTK